jgi:hypothetical protein
MSTLKQIEANRRNAQRSTGPRTEEGKAASRMNALKNGLYANSPVIPGEDPALFEALSRSYYERFNPSTPEEHTLLASVIRNAWLLDRFSNVETDFWAHRFERDADCLTETDADHPLSYAADMLSSELHILQRRIDAADRAFHRNLKLLMELQAARAQAVTGENGFVPAKRRPAPAPRPEMPPPTPAMLMKTGITTPRVTIGDSQLP